MFDIRKLLEKQLERLHGQSNIIGVENVAELTYAMLEIVKLLYLNGIPTNSENTIGEAKITISANEIISETENNVMIISDRAITIKFLDDKKNLKGKE